MNIIHAFVKFCMILNPTMCQELEITPADHAITSIMECMRGVSMGDQSEFTYQNAQWRIFGGRCSEEKHDPDIQAWLRDNKN